MGKGDRRSRRGKLFRGTFGNTRKHIPPVTVKAAVKPESKPEEPTEQKPEAAPKKKRPAKKKAE